MQPTGCVGACHREPLVEVVDNGVTTLYGPVAPGGGRAVAAASGRGAGR
ncbi:MAG: (2Fe-2S) ferredoxin domain-containing protein [Caldilineaceae bacterium]